MSAPEWTCSDAAAPTSAAVGRSWTWSARDASVDTPGEIFDAATALRIGLLHTVVEADALDAAIERQIALLLKAGPVAAARAKQLVARVAATADRDRADRDNADLIARLRVSPEGQEGLSAFLEKRTPRWVED